MVPDKEKFMNIIEPTNHANAFCYCIQNTCNSDVHEQDLDSKKINLGLCRMGGVLLKIELTHRLTQ